MSTDERPEEEGIRRLAEASAWRVHLSELDLQTSDEFEEWLAAHADNRSAWDDIEESWALVGDQATSPALLSLRHDALGRARGHGRRRGMGWTRHVALAAGLVLVFLGGLAAIVAWQTTRPLVYATVTGERRSVVLDDGSRLTLDANTEVQIRYSEDARRLVLLRGQGRFDVAPDADRPFSVRVRDQTVTAIGTVFDIDLLGPKLLVTLIEGRVVVRGRPDDASVAVAAKAGSKPAIQLVAGQQLVIAPQAPPRIEAISTARASAWETGMLVFEDETLSAVAERMNRYTRYPIYVAAGARDLKLSGVFKAGDAATFVDVVTRYLPVRATRDPAGTITLIPRNAD